MAKKKEENKFEEGKGDETPYFEEPKEGGEVSIEKNKENAPDREIRALREKLEKTELSGDLKKEAETHAKNLKHL